MKKQAFPEGVIYQGNCIEIMRSMPTNSVDLIFGSPPYEDARLYLDEDGRDLGISRDTEAWVEWMTQVYIESLRICRGLVAYVVGHGRGARRWSGAPALLCADLIRGGINLRSPAWFHRSGIMGSGGRDWLRADMEWIICATNEPEELFWSDNTACGHAPRYGPGGKPSNRIKSGDRVNESRDWYEVLQKTMKEEGLTYREAVKKLGFEGKTGWVRSRGGEKIPKNYIAPERANPGNVITFKNMREEIAKLMSKGMSQREACMSLGIPLKMKTSGYSKEGDLITHSDVWIPPEVANPGNVIHASVGGGRMGSNVAHENEAPFPSKLPNFFIRSFCPPWGTVMDPFGGSGTTLEEAVKLRRNFVTSDLRRSQVKLMVRRLKQARNRKGMGIED